MSTNSRDPLAVATRSLQTLGVKLEAVRSYATQFPATKAGIFGAIETMNRYHGLTAGFEAGELFMTYRSVGVDDLMRWACPAFARM